MKVNEAKKNGIGWLYLTLWALLIAAGIIAKRMYGHPNLMVIFHLPAAVFLVLAFQVLSKPFKEARLKEDLQNRADS